MHQNYRRDAVGDALRPCIREIGKNDDRKSVIYIA
jgi:hypothetical protein